MITIIGGRIGGLTTALAFEKHGIDYHIFEKVYSLKIVGAGIYGLLLMLCKYLGYL